MKKIIIGITGQYASGKSTVSKVFIERGFYQIDIDSYGHKALKIKQADIIKTFGKDVLLNNNINRKKLGKIVLNSRNELKKLNKIVHPFMVSEIKSDLVKITHKYIIINGALLVPMKLNKLCNKIVAIICNYEQIIKRGVDRDKRNLDQIKFILSNQPTTKQLIEIADYIIENNCTLSKLIKKAHKIIDDILSEN